MVTAKEKKEIISVVMDLIRFDTSTGNDKTSKECLSYVKGKLLRNKITSRITVVKNHYSLLSTFKPNTPIDYLFVGHIDVVPSSNPQAYQPFINKGKIYGRGAIDMKSEVGAMILSYIQAYKKYKKSESKLNIGILLTSDEEIGGYDGLKHYVDQNFFTAKCVILPDSGHADSLTIAEKGVFQVRLDSTGFAAHGSRPWQGENAIEKLMFALGDLKKNFPLPKKNKEWVASMNIGKIEGGNATNSVPSRACSHLDFRYRNDDDYSKIIKALDEVKKKYDITYTIVLSGKPVSVNPKDKYIKHICKIGKEYGINFKFEYAHGASDARHLSNLNIPIIMFRPNGSEAHDDNEWVDIESLIQFYCIISSFISNNSRHIHKI